MPDVCRWCHRVPQPGDTHSEGLCVGGTAVPDSCTSISAVGEPCVLHAGHVNPHADRYFGTWRDAPDETLAAYDMGRHGFDPDELRQPLQSIRTEAHNIKAKLEKLGIQDQDISEAQSAIDRGVQRIDENIKRLAEGTDA